MYGKHVLEKMSGWVGFQDVPGKGQGVMESVEEVGVAAVREVMDLLWQV